MQPHLHFPFPWRFARAAPLRRVLHRGKRNDLPGETESTKTPPPASVAPPDSPAKAGEDNFWTRDTLTGDWGGLRKQWEDKGVSVGAVWVSQGFRNFEGGIRVGNTAASTVDVNLTLDAEKSFGWTGAKFYADFQDHAGPDPSQYLVGDVQKFTKFNSVPIFPNRGTLVRTKVIRRQAAPEDRQGGRQYGIQRD